MPHTLTRLKYSNFWMTAVLIAFFFVAYLPVWKGLILTWSSHDEYSHGFFIVPISLFILWRKREKLAKTPIDPSSLGLALVIFSSVLYLFGQFAEIVTVSSFSMVLLIVGIVIYFYGLSMLKELAFPLFFLMFMIPIPSQVYSTLTIPLQLFVSETSARIAVHIGVPLYREGNIIHIPDLTLQVVQACSGLRSMASLLALSAILAYLTLQSNLLRAILFLSGIPSAIIVNVFRVLLQIIAFHYINFDLTAGTVHIVFGITIFLFSLIIIVATRGILSHWDKRTIEK